MDRPVGRALRAAAAGILLALPPAVLRADGPGGPPSPPPIPPQPGDGRRHEHEFDRQQMADMVRRKLEGHPKYRRAWERMSEDQRRKCIDRVVQKMADRRRDFDKEMARFENSPQKRRQRMAELKKAIRERMEKRRKEAEARHDREKPRDDRHDR